MLNNPIFDFSWVAWLLCALAAVQTTILSVTIYLHRAQAHRALTVHPALAHFFRAWLWLTTGMSTRQWVAVHRKHHAKCETDQDPHSPQVQGLARVFFAGAWLYAKQARDPENLRRYAAGAPDDQLEHKLYMRWGTLGPVLLGLLNVVLWGWGPGLGMTAIQLVWIPLWAAGVINGLGHFVGYRNFHSADASTNLFPWGLWIGGEELHNNHHAHPTSARLSYHWWELDIGWGAIRALQALGLAHVKHAMQPPKLAGEHTCWEQTWNATTRFRLQVERWFTVVWLREVKRLARSRQELQLWSKALELSGPQVEFGPDASGITLFQTCEPPHALVSLHAQWRQLQALWSEPLSKEQALVALQHWVGAAQLSTSAGLRHLAWRMRRLA